MCVIYITHAHKPRLALALTLRRLAVRLADHLGFGRGFGCATLVDRMATAYPMRFQCEECRATLLGICFTKDQFKFCSYRCLNNWKTPRARGFTPPSHGWFILYIIARSKSPFFCSLATMPSSWLPETLLCRGKQSSRLL